MEKWLSGNRGAGVALTLWLIGWSMGFGGLAELFVDPHGETLDIWPAEMAIPGLVGGVIFAALLRVSGGRGTLADVSLAQFTVLGVMTGLMLGGLSATTDGPIPLDLSAAEMIGLAVALCAVSAIGTATFLRLLARWQRRPSPQAA